MTFPKWLLPVAAVAAVATALAVLLLTSGGTPVPNVTPNNTVTANGNTNIDTADWATYTNTAYGYAFRYPRSWGLANSPSSSVIDPRDSSISFGDATASFGFDVIGSPVGSPDCVTVDECAEERLPTGIGQLYEDNSGLQPTDIGGLAGLGIRRVRLDSGRWHYRYVYILRNEALYSLHSIADPDSTGMNDALIDAVFNSVTFTK